MSFSGQLAALQKQVDELQKQINELSGDESLSPNYLTVNPTGQVGANFTGLINALGVVLPLGSFPTPQPQNSVEWTDTINEIVASMGASLSGGTYDLLTFLEDPTTGLYQAQLSMTASAVNDQSAAILQANAQNAEVAQIKCGAVSSGAAVSVHLTGGLARDIFDTNKNSSFVQCSGNGANVWLQAGSASPTLLPGLNSYSITFPFAFASTPVVTFVVEPQFGGSLTIIELAGPSTTGFNFNVNQTTGANEASLVNWHAVGPV